jgi:hypothetical protein
MEIVELAQMVLDFIRDFYQDPSTTGLDPKWVAMGFNAGEVKELITDVGLMGLATAKGIKYMSKKDVLPKLKKLFKLIVGKAEVKKKEKAVNTFKENGGVQIEGNSNLPPGVSSNHPHFNPPETTRPNMSSNKLFEVLWMDNELAILQSRGKLYAIYFVDIEGIEDYAEREIMGYEKDEDGDSYPEYHEDFEIDDEALENFLNDNYDRVGIGAGYEDWEHDSSRITKMDDEMKADILGTWNDPKLQQIFNNMDEVTTSGSAGAYVPKMGDTHSTYVDRDRLPSEELDETTDWAGVGGDSGTFAYDAPAGDGDDFWTAGNKLNKKITKGKLEENAKTDTQWPKGAFVKMPACSKLDNNKEAQNGGCNQGADAGIGFETSKDSVISNEALYYEVAKKTGRSVNEVESIIKGYNNN